MAPAALNGMGCFLMQFSGAKRHVHSLNPQPLTLNPDVTSATTPTLNAQWEKGRDHAEF
jgi:hypothetical protein